MLESFPAAAGVFILVTFINLPGTASKGVGVLLAIGLLARVATRGERDINFASAHPGATAALAAFLVRTLLGVLWADSASAVTTALQRYALNFVVFFIIYAAAR